MRAIGVFALVLALASPALAGPPSSTIGGKRIQQDNVHNIGVGYPSSFYEWWNRGRRKLDWALKGAVVYGDWATPYARDRFVRIGFGLSSPLRWHLASKRRKRVTNHTGFRFTPGILLAGNRASAFTFGVKAEVAAPVSIEVNQRVSVILGGAIPFAIYINNRDIGAAGFIPLLVRTGIEIGASKHAAPFLLFELGPGIAIAGGTSDVRFAWRIWAGTSFWGVTGK